MRIFLALWFIPVFILALWYGLSYYDFGFHFFSRELHDKVFNIYGELIGVDPELVPVLAAKAIAFDSLIVAAIVAFKVRKKWWPTVRGWFSSKPSISADHEAHTAS